MPNPYIPLATWTGSYSVQNRADENGTLATYVAIRGLDSNMQFQLAHTETPVVTFKLDRNIISRLTASMSSAYATTSTGSW